MKIEQCYGVIVVYKGEENLFLILERQGAKGDWTFPKGHTEEGETPKETALRELKEETGITEIELLDLPLIHEEYEIVVDEEKLNKMNDYFIGFVSKKNVNIEEIELQSYKWATYEEAFESFKYPIRKQTLKKAQEYLNMIK